VNTTAWLGVLTLVGAAAIACSPAEDEHGPAIAAGGQAGSGASAGAGGTGGSGTTTSAGGQGGDDRPLALVHEVGRFDRSDPNGPRFTWSGSAFRTRVQDAHLEVELDGPAGVFFQVVVDDSPTAVFETGGGVQTYTVADGLDAGPHDVEIYRRNEGFFGTVQLRGITAGSAGTLIETPRPWQRRIEFIGDSYTCGYGVEGPDATCAFSGDTESAYATYAAIAARQLEAEAHLIAYSGKGVFQNYGGDTNEPMPTLYGRTLTGDSNDTWDFTSWIADAVVLNLGTNDFSATVTEDQFVPAYVALLAQIRSHYPSAPIFCVSWAGWGSEHESWVQTAMTQSGDTNLSHLGFSIETSEGWGCDYHPSAATHLRVGQQLAQALRDELGW
jgi:lysophospholipase L1-like esterase